ncbi:helix-turn-helix domain-containing protein [Nonomuraea sp. NBC_01738]|uniref:helix-turn-helix domain-containing protein n=1 Tax=Nonomuraea sp. NBC_01738 TaxID=2976003 RepID=UPI002E1303DC|nr:helix-turn-helix domain-containing protein [Nonomuraea sp. NBC_01738]
MIHPAPALFHTTERAGVGPAVPLADLTRSWQAARVALRFTADGTAHDPGPRVVGHDDLGTLALLAAQIHPGAPRPPDVDVLEEAARTSPWMLATLDAIATSASLRTAATALTIHHSTLQSRLAQAARVIPWPLSTPDGRLRLHLALTARRLHRNPPT